MSEDQPIEIRDARHRDFFMVNNVIIDHYASIIGPFPLTVYTALCRHAHQSTRESYPSHAFLAKELRLSLATVKRSIATLVEHRLIARKRRQSKSGDPDTNIYIILEPWGRFPQNPPIDEQNIDEQNSSYGVGSDRPQVGSHRTEGRFPQNRGVGSVRATNNTHIEQDSLNKTNTPPIPPKKGHGIRGERLPQDWRPKESDLEWAQHKGFSSLVDIQEATEEFRAYWHSRSTQATRLDWSLTWQNRVRDLALKAKDRQARGSHRRAAPQETPGERQARTERIIREVEEEEAWKRGTMRRS